MPDWFLPAIVLGILGSAILMLFIGVLSESERREKAAFTAATILFPVGVVPTVVKAIIEYFSRGP
jgi:hypothetical protein